MHTESGLPEKQKLIIADKGIRIYVKYAKNEAKNKTTVSVLFPVYYFISRRK